MRKKESNPSVPFHKLLPNITTIFGICVGMTAIKVALHGNVSFSLYLLILAMILDAIDGKLARSMNSESEIGAELDTLADFFNFGIATPLIIYFSVFINSPFPNLGWIAVLIFSICCAFRLARFNVGLQSDAKEDHFVGVPAPALACLGLSPLFFAMLGVSVTEYYTIPTLLFIVLCGFLAVGRFPTLSLKSTTVSESMQFPVILLITILLICLVVLPWYTLLIGNMLYLISLPVFAIKHKRRFK